MKKAILFGIVLFLMASTAFSDPAVGKPKVEVGNQLYLSSGAEKFERPETSMVHEHSIWLTLFEKAVSPLATLLAAFSGAWFAYLLGNRRKSDDDHNVRIVAVQHTLFILFQQLNTLKLIQKKTIDPVRGHPMAYVAMQPMLSDDHVDMRYNFSNLIFLLSTKYKKVLIDTWLEQQRFIEAIRIINHRSDIHWTMAQPKLAAHGVEEGKEYTLSEIEFALGPHTYPVIKRATEQVIENVDATVISLDALRVRIRDMHKELFPGVDFLEFDLGEEDMKKPE